MPIYQITENQRMVRRDDGGDTVYVPFDLDNRDCRQFIENWAAGDPVFEFDGVTPFPDTPANRALLGLP